ncbi:hypothetical protein [Halodesulfovibrio marinisediminis]|uniref:Uncharacterized protein n=1 Tax=Halodesulfovibrio marinisediminis DSM 17456 TaxID=1121457 RepID=A0A1N6J6I1_9BACT|nr:hypothetical protein [Halodesulfovibrio marinisediminis]SIO39706.1 hypothetical protein SAMN02745161_3187 [Halodesulfovibrio marinisediminis DSM 17456]
MASNLSISNFKFPSTLKYFFIVATTFMFLNCGLFFVAPYFDSNYILMNSVTDSSWKKGGEYLFLGDSRSHQGLIPSVFEDTLAANGIKSTAVNLARPGMQIPFAYYFSQRVFDEADIQPKNIVVNFSFYLLGGKQWMKDIYFSYYRPSLKEVVLALSMKLCSFNKATKWYVKTRLGAWMFRKSANSMLNNYFLNYKAFEKEAASVKKMRVEASFDYAKGYVSRGDSHITAADLKPHAYSKGYARKSSVFFKYLKKMLQETSARNINVYIYRFPWPKMRNDDEGFHEILDHYWGVLKRETQGSKHVYFLDEKYFWPNENFVDPLHVNQIGAERLTTLLAKKIAKHKAEETARYKKMNFAQVN